MCDHLSLRALDNLIKDGNNSTFNGFKNYFLINLPSYVANDTRKIAEIFADSPLSYNSLTFAFVFTNNTHGNNLLDIIKLVIYIKKNCYIVYSFKQSKSINVNVFSENGDPYQTIEIYDVYKINSSSKDVEVSNYGNWSDERPGQGDSRESLLVKEELIWKRRGNLRGYHIR